MIRNSNEIDIVESRDWYGFYMKTRYHLLVVADGTRDTVLRQTKTRPNQIVLLDNQKRRVHRSSRRLVAHGYVGIGGLSGHISRPLPKSTLEITIANIGETLRV